MNEKRFIGLWKQENVDTSSNVGELKIEGNNIEFYGRFNNCNFGPFIASDGLVKYKVFSTGLSRYVNNSSIDNVNSYRVKYVLSQRNSINEGTEKLEINEVSFNLPELVEWFGVPLVLSGYDDNNSFGALELKYDNITLFDSNPKIEICFELVSYRESQKFTSATIIKEPRIKIIYSDTVDIATVLKEIECLTQFFALLIGKTTYVEDVRLNIRNQMWNTQLYINHDYSYNWHRWGFYSKPRTYYYVLENGIKDYYSNWREFFYDKHFDLLRRIYFDVNDSKEKYIEDVFVDYMRILDGYYSRLYGDEHVAENLKKALKDLSKNIKDILLTEDNRQLFETTIRKELPEWKYNSENKKDVASWIANGYLGKVSLSSKLKALDTFGIIKANAKKILDMEPDIAEGKYSIEDYYDKLGKTRNYYSHYKDSIDGVLNYRQMSDSINVLNATINSLLLEKMGVEDKLISKILAFDTGLERQTHYLREENDSMFIEPIKMLATNIDIEASKGEL